MNNRFLSAIAMVLVVSGLSLTESLNAQSESFELGFGHKDLKFAASDRLLSLTAAKAADLDYIRDRVEQRGADIVEILPRRGVLLVEAAQPEVRAEVLQLADDPAVRLVAPVHHLGGSTIRNSRYVVTPHILVGFSPETNSQHMNSVVAASGATVEREFAFAPKVLRLESAGSLVELRESLSKLQAAPGVVFAHIDWLRPLGLRETLPNDPLFGNQWHLKNTGQGFGTVGADTRATFAWDYSMGAGTTIAVIDTGVDNNHGDLLQTVDGYDPLLGAIPGGADDAGAHGTRVAGVAAAMGGNGSQLVGVAPSAMVMPIRLLTGSGYGTPSEEAACFQYAVDNGADVITNSWGPDGVPFPLPPLVDAAFTYATTVGRGGNGCPIFWAAGNGAEDIAADEYVSSPLTIAVGASTNYDERALYSDFGLALDIVAPSSGGSRAVSTLTINSGTTLNFGGTSASAPQAAGCAALMISAVPAIDWTDIRDIMRSTAAKIAPVFASYDANGFSVTYGYGRLDCEAAVLAALVANASQPQLSVFSWGIGDINIHISNMVPNSEWRLGISSQLYSPLGSGPLLGVGIDAFQTLVQPLGVVPFHSFADAQGNFQWGAIVPLTGITIQTVAVVIQPGVGFQLSNVTQTSF